MIQRTGVRMVTRTSSLFCIAILSTTAVAGVVLIAGCANQEGYEARARQALREAEVACDLPKGRLKYLGASDDPRRKYASTVKPPLAVMTTSIGSPGQRVYECLRRFKSRQGYQLEQLKTD